MTRPPARTRSRTWCARLLCALAFAAALPAAAQFSTSDDDPQAQAEVDSAAASASQAWSDRLSTTLAAKGGARNLAFAATLRTQQAASADAPQGDDPSQAIPDDAHAELWRRTAAASAGGDVLANQLLLAAGGETRSSAAQRWLAAEPDNAAALVEAGQAPDAALAAVAGSRRYDQHYLEGVRWLRTVYAAGAPTADELAAMFGTAPPPSRDAFAVNAAMGAWSALVIPPRNALVDACGRREAVPGSARAAGCVQLAQRMAEADTWSARSIGLAMLAALAPDDATRADARARRLRQDWTMAQWADAVRRQPDDGAAQLARLLDDASVRTEIDLVQRVLRDAGIALDPPAGWTPPPRRSQR